MSPSFGSHVKDIFLKYSNGDLSIAKQVVDNHDKKNKTKTHLEIAQNPNKNDAIMIANSYKNDSDEIKEKYEELLLEMELMKEEKNNLLIKYHTKNKEVKKLTKDNNKLSVILHRMEQKIEETKEDNKITHFKLDRTYEQYSIIKNQLIILQDSMEAVLEDRVVRKYITEAQDETLIIYKDNRKNEDYNYYVIRSKKNLVDSLIQKQKTKFDIPENKIEKFYEIKNSPNARIYWLSFIKKYGDMINRYKNTQWFGLKKLNEKIFKKRLLRLDQEKYDID